MQCGWQMSLAWNPFTVYSNIGVGSVHAMKTYRDSIVTAPLILNLSSRWGSVVTIMPWLLDPWRRTLAGWVPGTSGHFLKRERALDPTRIQTPHCPAHSLVTIPNTNTSSSLYYVYIKMYDCKINALLTSKSYRKQGGIWRSHNSAAENQSLLGYTAVPLFRQFLTFKMIAVASKCQELSTK